MKYLVPYDFTPVTRSALDHTLAIAKSEPGEIELLHVISEESARSDAETHFTELLGSLSEEERKLVTTKIRVGNIFHDINLEAEEGNFQLLIMGTHGAKGLQKLLGSHAIKVITSSSTPFIITQEKGPNHSIERIVLPVDLSHERVQIASFAGELAKKFHAEVHIVSKPQRDEFLVKRLNNNINKVRRQLKKDGVTHEVSQLDGKQAFHKEVIDYGAKHRADLFAIAHYPETLLPQFENFSQALITNKLETPVLIVNAKEVAGVKSAYSFIGI